MAKGNEEHLDKIRSTLLTETSQALYKDLETMVDEEVAEPLEKLNGLVKSYSGPKDAVAWRPQGDPTLHLRNHDAKVYTAYSSLIFTILFIH